MKKKVFTLVELIITIAIIAVLAVTAIVMITKWISKSRDSARLSDISIIEKSLETNVINSKTYLMPDNAVNVYDTGNALARYQGEFTDKVSEKLGTFRFTPKDPQGRNYGYSLSNDKKQYQIRAFLENTSFNNYINTTNAATQIAKINGNYNGFLVTTTGTTYNLWNVSTLFVWSGTAITSGLNYLNENNKPIDNTTNLAVANVSGLYDGSSSNDSTTLDTIVSTFSGTNSVNTSQLAQLTMKTAAGGVTLLASSGGGSCPDPVVEKCLLTTSACGAGYNLIQTYTSNGNYGDGSFYDCLTQYSINVCCNTASPNTYPIVYSSVVGNVCNGGGVTNTCKAGYTAFTSFSPAGYSSQRDSLGASTSTTWIYCIKQ